jgi:Mlc titration factor MtfA (ptsG expression regulator)
MALNTPTWIFLLAFAGLAMGTLVHQLWMHLQKRRENRAYEGKHMEFDNALSRYNPYYKSLSKACKDRFMDRVVRFMEHKHFQYVDLEPEDNMPLLISAAAIQLTFGLEHYLLDYFENIFILKDNYRYGMYNMPFEGHVSEDGIYLSWNNFMKESADYTDGQNLGLHEMAHALTYVNFSVDDGRDWPFHDRFKEFSVIARPIFDQMKAGGATFLSAYAATNYQEFWAVSVESFFERPTSFKIQLPQLYSALCTLLNQDPLIPDKVLTADPHSVRQSGLSNHGRQNAMGDQDGQGLSA